MVRAYRLIGADGSAYSSTSPGTLGGHRRSKGYGRLDCPTALRWIAKGHYVRHRVFFADEPTAIAAGYRPCGHCLPERYAEWKAGRWPGFEPGAQTTVGFKAPLHADALLGFLGARAIPGVEEVEEATVRRSVRLPHGPAVVEATIGPETVAVSLPVGDQRDLGAAARLAARLLDLGANAPAVDDVLAMDPFLAPLVARRPGIRSPGCTDGGELLVRAIAGQQVSVAGARTVLGRIAAALGDPLDRPVGRVTRLFPTAERLAGADPALLPMPRSRSTSILAAAAAVADGRLRLKPGTDRAAATAALLDLPGVGPWTADYVAMRALGEPDVLLDSDLWIRRALASAGHDGTAWSPFGSYATHHLWAAASAR